MKRPHIMTDKVIKFFIVSHIVGWILANVQTVWIIWEIRRSKKKVGHYE